jgi:hypothetical protein
MNGHWVGGITNIAVCGLCKNHLIFICVKHIVSVCFKVSAAQIGFGLSSPLFQHQHFTHTDSNISGTLDRVTYLPILAKNHSKHTQTNANIR